MFRRRRKFPFFSTIVAAVLIVCVAGEVKTNAGLADDVLARMSAAGWIDRATADSMGMLATVMNSLALETALNAAGVSARRGT